MQINNNYPSIVQNRTQNTNNYKKAPSFTSLDIIQVAKDLNPKGLSHISEECMKAIQESKTLQEASKKYNIIAKGFAEFISVPKSLDYNMGNDLVLKEDLHFHITENNLTNKIKKILDKIGILDWYPKTYVMEFENINKQETLNKVRNLKAEDIEKFIQDSEAKEARREAMEAKSKAKTIKVH